MPAHRAPASEEHDAPVSVVIVSHNSRTHLGPCLDSLRGQEVAVDITVVDNASSDDTVSWLGRQYPEVRTVALTENRGYGGANNIGIHLADGEYVLVLNPDTVVRPGALEELVRVARARSRVFVSPLLLQPDGTVNACGNSMHVTGITTCIGMGQAAALYRGVVDVPTLSGAAILASRGAWRDVGGFDAGYFLYMEDADLSVRARTRGYGLVCAAEARIEHRYALNMSARKFYLLERNRLLTILKLYQRSTLLRMLPALLLTEVATWIYAAMGGRAYVNARFAGYSWLWRERRTWRRARRAVQANRTVKDDELMARMSVALPFDQLIRGAGMARCLRACTTPLYQLAAGQHRAA